MKVVASLDGVYNRLWDKLLVILTSQAVKTFFVSGFIFILFYMLIGRHLLTLASYAESFNPNAPSEAFTFKRRKFGSPDELDQVVTSMNLMRNRLNAYLLELKESERALSESEEKYRNLHETMVQGVVYQDATGRIISANKAAENILGVTQDQMQGLTSVDPSWRATNEDGSELKGEEHPSMIALQTRSIVKSKIMGVFNPKHDRYSWINVNAVPQFKNGENEPFQVYTIFEDITERKQAKERLRANEAKLHLMIEQSPLGVCINDLDGTFVSASPAYEKLIGYTEEELQKLTFFDITHPDDWPENRRLFQDMTFEETTSFRMEKRYIRKDGSEISVIIHAGPICDPSGSPLFGMALVEDITERKQAEEALCKSEAHNRTLVETLPDLVWLKAPDGVYLSCNHMFGRFFGAKEVDIIGKTDYDFVDKDLADFFRDHDRKAMEADSPSANEEWLTFADETGYEGLFETIKSPMRDADGTLIGVVGIARDITERKRAEEERNKLLSDTKERIKELRGLYGVSQAITDCADMDDLFKQTAKLLPLSWQYPEIACCRMIFDEVEYYSATFEPTSWKQTADIIVDKKVRGVIGIYYLEERLELDEGPFLSEERDLIDGVAKMLGETIKRKQAEEEKFKLEAQLYKAQKMESVGRLAGGVAHDFNNLLTGINGNIYLAQMNIPSNDPLYEMLDEIKEFAGRAADLTRQLLAFSRKQIIIPKIINPNDLIKNMHKLLARIIGEDITIKTIPRKHLGRIKADPGQVEQIIVNLAVNARDAMPDGGKLTIETANVSLGEDYCKKHPNVKQGNYVMLAISDNGEGMNEEILKNIFDPFFTTKAEGQGTGLGLATVYGIVKQHGGNVEVYSEIGVGTIFKVYFPLVRAKAEIITRSSPLINLPRGTETVFIVEDELLVRKIAIKILTRLGYKVMSVDDGVHALSDIKKSAIQIDLLLTDVVMPNMNGRELAEKVQMEYPEMKVLFTSGYTENVIAHHGILDEGLNFIGKPYTPQALAEKVRKVLDGLGS